jgi:DNA-binding cell septation regulator SpoVG
MRLPSNFSSSATVVASANGCRSTWTINVSNIQILDWRELRRNTLLGFAKVELPSGMVINDVTVLMGKEGPWASPPSKPMIDRDGVAMKDQNGKLKYVPIIEFTSKQVRDRFSHAVVDALCLVHPELRTGGAA